MELFYHMVSVEILLVRLLFTIQFLSVLVQMFVQLSILLSMYQLEDYTTQLDGAPVLLLSLSAVLPAATFTQV